MAVVERATRLNGGRRRRHRAGGAAQAVMTRYKVHEGKSTRSRSRR